MLAEGHAAIANVLGQAATQFHEAVHRDHLPLREMRGEKDRLRTNGADDSSGGRDRVG